MQRRLPIPPHWLSHPLAARLRAARSSRPIAAGGLPRGPTDITMRSLADNASKILGQPVIVENSLALAARCQRSCRFRR
jgi:hypothetical protein